MDKWTPRPPSEAQFQDAVAEFAQACGWAVVHFGTGKNLSEEVGYSTAVRYDAAGFPDLTLIHQRHPHLVWFRELKSDRTRHRLSDAQRRWRALLTAMGHNYDVWWPAKWEDICRSLAGGRVVSATPLGSPTVLGA